MKLKFTLVLLLVVSGTALCQTTISNKHYKKAMLDAEQEEVIETGSDTTATTRMFPFHWFPSVKSQNFFDNDAPKFFQNNVISYNDSLSNIALYSELAADFIGPVRISAGITLAYPKSDTNTVKQQKVNREKFIQRFTTGGGSLVFNFNLPVFVYNQPIFGAAMSAGPRFAIDPPSFGVTEGKFAHNTAFGTDLLAELRGIKDIIKFYGNARISYVTGNSTFYDALALTGGDRKGFFLNNYVIGVDIKNVFTLSYTKYWGSGNIKDRLSGYLTFTVSPEF